MENYWIEDKKARVMIEGLISEGLRGNAFSDESYDLDNQIEIKGEYCYFFADVYKGKNGKAPTVEVGFALGIKPEKDDIGYISIKKQLNKWRKKKEKLITTELKKLSGLELNVMVPVSVSNSQYPLVYLKGTDGVRLMKQAKDIATKLIDKKYKLAEWYFER